MLNRERESKSIKKKKKKKTWPKRSSMGRNSLEEDEIKVNNNI